MKELASVPAFFVKFVEIFAGLGVYNWITALIIILLLFVVVIGIFWNKGLKDFFTTVYGFIFNGRIKNNKKRATLETELSKFLERESKGENQNLVHLEQKFDEKIEKLVENVSVIKKNIHNIMRDVETHALTKEAMQKIFNDETLKSAATTQMELINNFYDMFKERIFVVLGDDYSEGKTYRILHGLIPDFAIISQKKYMKNEININIQRLINDADEPTQERMDEYYEQLADIYTNTSNGSRRKIIEKHLEMCKYVHRDIYAKEFWRLAKQKYEL